MTLIRLVATMATSIGPATGAHNRESVPMNSSGSIDTGVLPMVYGGVKTRL